jgi:periplasmic protein TonB
VPRDMFGDVVESSIKVGSQKWYTVPLSILVHVIIIGAVIIVPLMATDMLPTPPAMMAFSVAAPPPPPPPPPPPAPAAAPTVKPVPVANPAAAPIEPPKEIVPEAPAPGPVSEGVPGGVVGGVPGGTVGGVVGGLPEAPPPPPPPPSAPVRVGGQIKAPTKLRDVRPVYPQIAQSARVAGIVIIEATISPQGKVMNARVLRGVPLLNDAALDAVKQWEYTPTLLNGVPVPVIMTVTVNFTLQS